MRDKHALCDLGALSESHPDHGAFIRALIDELRSAPADAGFLVHALKGFSMRHHFDRYHPAQVELGISDAPPEGPAREAWLFGYRFVETKEPDV